MALLKPPKDLFSMPALGRASTVTPPRWSLIIAIRGLVDRVPCAEFTTAVVGFENRLKTALLPLDNSRQGDRSKDGDAATGLQPVKCLLDDRRLLQTMESFAYGDEVNRLCSNQRLLRPPNAPIDISNSSARGLAAAHLNHLGFKIDRVYMLEAVCEVQCHASRPAGQVKKNSRRR